VTHVSDRNQPLEIHPAMFLHYIRLTPSRITRRR
jgi:hypothetical protein